jgi:hypothetical protein
MSSCSGKAPKPLNSQDSPWLIEFGNWMLAPSIPPQKKNNSHFLRSQTILNLTKCYKKYINIYNTEKVSLDKL